MQNAGKEFGGTLNCEFHGKNLWDRTLGATEKARDWVLKAIKIDPEDPATLYNAACFYTSQGEYDKALDVLEKILKPGTSLWTWIKHDDDFKALRTMDRYQRMTDKFQK